MRQTKGGCLTLAIHPPNKVQNQHCSLTVTSRLVLGLLKPSYIFQACQIVSVLTRMFPTTTNEHKHGRHVQKAREGEPGMDKTGR